MKTFFVVLLFVGLYHSGAYAQSIFIPSLLDCASDVKFENDMSNDESYYYGDYTLYGNGDSYMILNINNEESIFIVALTYVDAKTKKTEYSTDAILNGNGFSCKSSFGLIKGKLVTAEINTTGGKKKIKGLLVMDGGECDGSLYEKDFTIK